MHVEGAVYRERMSERKNREGEDSGERQVHLQCKDIKEEKVLDKEHEGNV